MAEEIIEIDGVPFTLQTYTFQISDLDDANGTYRSEGTGLACRDRVATKVTIGAGPAPLTGDELKAFLASMQKDFFEVKYIDPREDDWITGTFYCADRKLNMLRIYRDGVRLWEVEPVELVEQ